MLGKPVARVAITAKSRSTCPFHRLRKARPRANSPDNRPPGHRPCSTAGVFRGLRKGLRTRMVRSTGAPVVTHALRASASVANSRRGSRFGPLRVPGPTAATTRLPPSWRALAGYATIVRLLISTDEPAPPMSNFLFSRPDDPTPRQIREPVDGQCQECGAENLMRYPVLSEGGWYMTVKCQQCLHSHSREKWTRLGHVSLMTDVL